MTKTLKKYPKNSRKMPRPVSIPVELLGKNICSEQIQSNFTHLEPWTYYFDFEGELFYIFPRYGIEFIFTDQMILDTIFYNVISNDLTKWNYTGLLPKGIHRFSTPTNLKKQLGCPYLARRGDHRFDKWHIENYSLWVGYNQNCSKIEMVTVTLLYQPHEMENRKTEFNLSHMTESNETKRHHSTYING